jgi:LAO/AO transport system kinase
MFVLLQLPNAGDDLQAIKKGVMELADLVVINKADIDPDAATRARAQITSALRLLGMHAQHGHPDRGHEGASLWLPRVIQISALKGAGLDDFWSAVSTFRELQQASGRLALRRQQQNLAWMWERIESGLRARFRAHPEVRGQLGELTAQVREGRTAASVAARRLLDLMT